MHVGILYVYAVLKMNPIIILSQHFVKRETFVYLVIVMDVLKCAAMGYGEQYAVMNFGMITMLE